MQNNNNKLLDSLIFDSYELNNMIQENKFPENIDFLNSFWYELFYDLYNNNSNFKDKINDISIITNSNFNNKKELIDFISFNSNKNMINSIKYLTIIFWLEKILTILDKLPLEKSIFLKKIKILDFYLNKNYNTEEENFKIKFMAMSKKEIDLDLLIKVIQKKSNIYTNAIKNNPEKLNGIKMNINSQKLKYIREI